jgi:hypothetical protein
MGMKIGVHIASFIGMDKAVYIGNSIDIKRGVYADISYEWRQASVQKVL